MIVFSSFLIIIFFILALNHLIFAYLRIIKQKDGYTYVPLVNGLIGFFGVLLFPGDTLTSYWWLPFIIDWGCLPLLVELIISWCLKKNSKEIS